MIEYEKGGGDTVSPPSKQPLIQNNLEMYRNLKGTVYTSWYKKKRTIFVVPDCRLIRAAGGPEGLPSCYTRYVTYRTVTNKFITHTSFCIMSMILHKIIVFAKYCLGR